MVTMKPRRELLDIKLEADGGLWRPSLICVECHLITRNHRTINLANAPAQVIELDVANTAANFLHEPR